MQPEFLSGEASASPAVEPLLEGARKLDAMGRGAGALSARNGLRMTTHAALPFGLISANDFVEVVDYDPHLDRVMCLGSRAPHPHAGLHALVLRAKREINALAMVEAAGAPGLAALPRVERGRTHLESALKLLEGLRGVDAVAFERFIVATGRTPQEAVARVAACLGEGA